MQTIHIALIGANGSGKNHLRKALTRNLFTRPEDLGQFCFHVDTFNFQTVPTYLPSQYEITLILFGLTDRVSPELRLDLGNAIDLAYDLQEIYQKNDRVSLVATKHDLVPRQWSGVNLYLALEENRLAYPDDIKLHKVSSVTGEGVSDLREYTVNLISPPSPWINPWEYASNILNTILDNIAQLFTLSVPLDINCDMKDKSLSIANGKTQLVFEDTKEYFPEGINRNDMSFDPEQPQNIAHNMTIKYSSPYELYNMDFIRRNTTIPVPQPRHRHVVNWLITDYVPGRTLEECWDSLSMFMQFRIACTLRGYIKQLQSLKGSTPGAPDGYVRGALFNNTIWGPFTDARQFRCFCEASARYEWIDRMSQHIENPVNSRPLPIVPSNNDWSLSFVHGDLGPKNIILSDENVLWIVNWGSSGYYPSWMEGTHMGSDSHTQPWSWNWWRWFMLGRKACQGGEFWKYALSTISLS